MYRLSFSARSNVKTRVEFVPLMASAPWGALGGLRPASLSTRFSKTFTYFFLPTKSSDTRA